MKNARFETLVRHGLAFGLLASMVSHAAAQNHVHTAGDYTLRVSSVSSLKVAAGTAKEHGITPSDDTAVLNAVVEHRGVGHVTRTMPAEVHAQVKSLTGKVQDIDMKQTAAGGYIAYLGSYQYLPREVLDITVTAKPVGSEQPIRLTYRERLWANQR